MKKAGANALKKTFEFLLLAAILAAGLFLAFLLTGISDNPNDRGVSSEREKNILIVGKKSRQSYLEQIYFGAQGVAQDNMAAVSLYSGKPNDQDFSMQELFNYASYLNADGVIALIDSGAESLKVPQKIDGQKIPLVTVGTYMPNLEQLSFIGSNYSELGKTTAREIVSLIGPGNKAILLDSNEGDDANHSNLMAGLLTALSSHPEISIKTLQFEKSSSFSREDSLRQQLASQEGLELIVSLAEQNTILAAQSVRDLNLSGRVKIIGFGDSADSREYFDKGIVTELICVKTQDIGKKAIQELFEYLQNGYANSFVSAEVEVLRGGAL